MDHIAKAEKVMGFPVVIDESEKAEVESPIVFGDFHEAYGKCPCRFVKFNLVTGEAICIDCGNVRGDLTCKVVDNPKLTMDKLKELTKDSSLVLRKLQKRTGLNTIELTDKIEAGEISIDILEGL
jgi:hypothetical protein